ncbi:MAG: 23S rRNA (guanosine(2251)-2'-O)-methyltransferase RlmB [Legionella sp. 21-45-4]|nr:MAG: 23S rRNA (guanosine(2251)-2'-O)-methyltransferase RlmB [Legionella sp. 21-45-4]
MAAAKTPAFILILDGITDPHNLGACLRSADAAGVHCVITPKDNSARITPVVSKVASGAAESVPLIQVTNLARTLDRLKQLGIWIYGAAGEAPQSLYTMNLTAPTALVLGSEGNGLRRLTRDHCDELFSLPMQGQVSSLNVSVASGIAVYETLRQRLHC